MKIETRKQTSVRALQLLVAATALAAGMSGALALSATASAATTGTAVKVVGVGSSGLNERSAPSTSASRVGNLANGSTVYVACQAGGVAYPTGGTPASDSIWDELTNGSFVADYWVSTKAVGTFTGGIPRCGITQVSVWNNGFPGDEVKVCGTNQSNQGNVCTPPYSDPSGSNNYVFDYWFKGALVVYAGNGSGWIEFSCSVPAGYSWSIMTCEI